MLKKQVSNVIEKFVEHGMHCLPCSYANDILDLSSWQLWCHIDAKMTSSWRYSAKGHSKTFDSSIVAMVTYLWHHWCRSMADSIKSLKILWSMVEKKSAMLHQIFSDFINWNSFNKNLKFFSNIYFFASHLILCWLCLPLSPLSEDIGLVDIR